MKLRPFSPRDANALVNLLNDRALSDWTVNIPYPYSLDDAERWIERTSKGTSRFPYAVELDGSLVACVSYWACAPYSGDEDDSIEVGYWVGKAFWGQGIASAALMGLLSNLVPPKINAVYAKAMTHNIASQKVLTKCGFDFIESGSALKQGRSVEVNVYRKSLSFKAPSCSTVTSY